MRHKARVSLLLSALLVGALFVLAACGEEEEEATPTTAAVAPTATTAPAAATATTAPEATPTEPPEFAYLEKHGEKLVSYMKQYHPQRWPEDP